jgi:hypothetical protein
LVGLAQIAETFRLSWPAHHPIRRRSGRIPRQYRRANALADRILEVFFFSSEGLS